MKKEIIEEIKDYEKGRRKGDTRINCFLVKTLWNLVKEGEDIFEIREEYKKILEEKKKYSNNYYSRICILLNVMKANFDRLKDSGCDLCISEFRYIIKNMAGTASLKIGNGPEESFNTYSEEVDYEDIKYKEGILGSNTDIDKILEEANDLIDQKDMDLKQAEKWIKKYKKYIIMNYGRWSKEYEEFMNIPFGLEIFFPSPGLCLRARRTTMKKGLEYVLERKVG